jgi:hypothetical protein
LNCANLKQMHIKTEAKRFASVTSQVCNIFFRFAPHITRVQWSEYEVGINIFAKCVVLDITCSSGIEVHIEQKYSIAEKRIKMVTLDTT